MSFLATVPNISGLSDIEAGFALIVYAFEACVEWFDDVVNATGAEPVIMALVGLVLLVSMLLIPLRGNAVLSGSPFAEAATNHIRQKKNPRSYTTNASNSKGSRSSGDHSGGK